jgi:two-component system KDP operon response regulator KdpE
MDLRVPLGDGLELVRVLRAAANIPILVIAAHHSTELAVRALDTGADDCVDTQADRGEIVARLRAAIRRYARHVRSTENPTVVRTGTLVIDRGSQFVTKRGAAVQLTRTEYRLLDTLALRPGQIAPHRYLLSTVWGDASADDTHYLRVYIGYLRNKIEDEPARPRYLLNEWGTGYRLAMLPFEEAASPRNGEHAVASGLLGTPRPAPNAIARKRAVLTPR